MKIPNNPTALYLSHGGGPMPLLGDAGHKELNESLTEIAARMSKPSAIIVISAHREEEIVTITHGARPAMIYDYYGFPKEAYEIEYPAPGIPDLARQVHALFEASQIDARLDNQRGFDHGLYVPLLLMYPEADVPCIQISLKSDLDASEHIRIGEALSGLTHNGLLIIGSGFSFHNMKAFGAPNTPESTEMNEAFEAWLINTCSSKSLDEAERVSRLANWESAPSARYCHPREEHLLLLHVCYGTVKRPCSAYLELSIINKKASFYFW